MNVPYVSFCDEEIRVSDVPDNLVEQLKKEGAQIGEKARDYYFPISDLNDRVSLFIRLRDLGFAFAGGREWSPAEQFEELRDKGKIKGKFQCIIWRGPGAPQVFEK